MLSHENNLRLLNSALRCPESFNPSRTSPKSLGSISAKSPSVPALEIKSQGVFGNACTRKRHT